MNLLETIRNRKSVRAFTDEPVSRAVLEKILSDASRAPSAINMQPWEVHMVLGQERVRLSRKLLAAYRERQVTCGPGTASPVPDRFMARARECADGMAPLLESMSTDFRTYVNEGSLNFYGAPAVALLFLDECFLPDRLTDIGSFIAYLILTAAEYGLSTCPIGLVRAYEDAIKDHLNVPPTKSLVISVALGKRDPTAPINEFRSPRVALDEFVRWID